MARQYNTKKFFRQAPNALLARCFKKHKVLTDFDLKTLKEGNPDPLFTAWLELSASKRARMDTDFQEIYALSCEQGTKVIIDEARHWIVTVAGKPMEPFMDWIAGLKNDYDRAFQTFLKYPDYWKGANNFFHADSLSWWRKRKGLPKETEQCDDASLKELSDKIIHYFHYADGTGTNCVVEPFRRNDLDYFFVYPEDYSQRAIEWVKGEFKPRPHTPAFEIIFVYCQADGTLDINYKGDRKAIEPLQNFFCEAILKLDEMPSNPKDKRVYDLNPLQKGFTPQFDPGGGIQEVRVTKLRLSSCLKQGDRINLEANSEDNPNAVYELMEKVAKGLPMKYFNVIRVDFSASVVVDSDKLNMHKSERLRAAADDLYEAMRDAGIDVLFEDRKVRAGFMFADMELVGIPHRVVLGDRGLDSNTVEYRGRRDTDNQTIPLDQIVGFLKQKLGDV